MEINPDNPGMKAMRNSWQTLLILVMAKLGVDEITVTMEDCNAFEVDMKKFIIADFRGGESITIRRMFEADALAYAKKAGEKI